MKRKSGIGPQLYPAKVEIVFASGRVERLTIKERLEEYRRDLKLMQEEGAIKSYSVKTADDLAKEAAGGGVTMPSHYTRRHEYTLTPQGRAALLRWEKPFEEDAR